MDQTGSQRENRMKFKMTLLYYMPCDDGNVILSSLKIQVSMDWIDMKVDSERS